MVFFSAMRIEECSTLGKMQHSSLSLFSLLTNHNGGGAGLILTNRHTWTTMEKLILLVSEYSCLNQMEFLDYHSIMKIMLGETFHLRCLCHIFCFNIVFKYDLFLWWQSWIFSIITSVSHDPSEIVLIYWFAAQETFLIIINVEKICPLIKDS